MWQAGIKRDAQLHADTDVLGLDGRTDIVTAALAPSHRSAAEQRMENSVDELCGTTSRRYPSGSCQQRPNVRGGSCWQATGGNRPGHLVGRWGPARRLEQRAYPMRIVVTLRRSPLDPPLHRARQRAALTKRPPLNAPLEGRESDLYARLVVRYGDGGESTKYNRT